MKLVVLGVALMMSFNVSAQESRKGIVLIDLKDTLSGVAERSQVAWECTQISRAAVRAHALGSLPELVNEAARFKATGNSESQIFERLTTEHLLDPRGQFLVPALIFAQLNIAWLEQQNPYKPELEAIYSSYVAAACSSVARFSPGS